jgi:hypothetical protein
MLHTLLSILFTRTLPFFKETAAFERVLETQ